jgi:hypothetical protein
VTGRSQSGAILIFAAKVRKADNSADQRKEHAELQVLEQKGSHRSHSFSGRPTASVLAMCAAAHRNSIGKSVLPHKDGIKVF